MRQKKHGKLLQILLFLLAFIVVFVVPLIQGEINEVIEIRGWRLIASILLIVVAIIASLIWNKEEFYESNSAISPHSFLPDNCGEEPLDLNKERLSLSSNLGSYFASLLEMPSVYLNLRYQISCAVSSETFESSPIQSILHELIDRNGAQIIIIAADGGMGKSTLAAKIVRCLCSQHEIERVLGDSAKSEIVDIPTGKTIPTEPGFKDPSGFYAKLAAQVGMTDDLAKEVATPDFIRNRLGEDKAVIVLDNLETVRKGDKLLRHINVLVSRNIRAIITTRQIELVESSRKALVVHLKPLLDLKEVQRFVLWHIQHFEGSNPYLGDLRNTLNDYHTRLLIDKSGGVPLVIQLLLSDIALNSWEYLRHLPQLPLSQDFLNYLYRQKWNFLNQNHALGNLSINILYYLANRQRVGKRTNASELHEYFGTSESLTASIALLQQQFLVVNRDISRGDFILFPALIDFLKRQPNAPF
ncbi:MAG: hypothetical protein BroJett018_27560 [Chloroflexota bacterium]|nr:MAG: hypothetical protein BroJett018_27560 [Chloroflexota bacterium]